MDERTYIRDCIIIEKDKRILELGPLNRPIISKDEYPNCFYVDIRDTEEIKKLYSGNEYLETTGIEVDTDTIVDIDYVLKDSYQKTFDGVEKFDYIVASHVLEHTGNLIDTLQDFASVLKPGAHVCIVYPDKRYCFDHFREAASFRDAFDVYTQGTIANARMVLDFYFSAVEENSPVKYWHPEHIERILPKNDFERAKTLYEEAKTGMVISDVHYWPFTDEGFIRFLYDCIRAKLLPFHCKEFHPTQEDTQEFLVLLEYDKDIFVYSEKELDNLRNNIESAPLDFFNVYYGMGEQNNLKWEEKVEELQKDIIRKNQILINNEDEFEKYRKVVKEQQEALEAYQKQSEYIAILEKEVVKYRKVVKEQQEALEAYQK